MKKTFVDVLLELPVDTTLQNFLTTSGLPLPADLSWSDGQEVTRTVIEAIRAWPDEIARDELIAKLMASVGLGDAAGKQAMFQVAKQDGSALMGLVASQSDIHRSFWLYVNHPALFDLAGDVDFFERHGSQAQQNDLGVKRKPDTSESALLGMRQSISAFYQRELQCGDGSVAYVLERSPDVYAEHGSAARLVREMDIEGHTTKSWVTQSGQHREGRPIDQQYLFCLLRNRLYLGEIIHKGEFYPAQHEPIVSSELWDHVHAFVNKRKQGPRERKEEYPALLGGLLLCRKELLPHVRDASHGHHHLLLL